MRVHQRFSHILKKRKCFIFQLRRWEYYLWQSKVSELVVNKVGVRFYNVYIFTDCSDKLVANIFCRKKSSAYLQHIVILFCNIGLLYL